MAFLAPIPLIGGLATAAMGAAANPKEVARTMLQFSVVGGGAAWVIFGLNGRRIKKMMDEGKDRTFDAAKFELGSGSGSASSTASTGSFPGCNAGADAIAKWMADQGQAAGMPRALLPGMSLQESGLQCYPPNSTAVVGSEGAALFGIDGGTGNLYQMTPDEAIAERISRWHQIGAPTCGENDVQCINDVIHAMQVNADPNAYIGAVQQMIGI